MENSVSTGVASGPATLSSLVVESDCGSNSMLICDATKKRQQDHLFNYGNRMVAAGEKPGMVKHALRSENIDRCRPPLSLPELEQLMFRINLAAQSMILKTPTANQNRSRIHSAEQWSNLDLTIDESEVLIGTAENAIIRPLTKNLIEGPDKAFKTTFLKRLLLAAAAGQTVFRHLPIARGLGPVPYLHGELSPQEIKERTRGALAGLNRPVRDFYIGSDLNAHLIEPEGQKAIEKLVGKYRPAVLVLDPWQSFITGADENSFKDVSRALKFLDRLIDSFHLTLFLPIHTGKNRDLGARGHSSIAGWRDSRISLQKTKSADSIKVSVHPRWAKPLQPFSLSFRDGTLWEAEGESLFTPQASQLRQIAALNGGSIGHEALQERMGLNRESLRKALARAQNVGAIHFDDEQVYAPQE